MAFATGINVNTGDIEYFDLLNVSKTGQYQGTWNASTNDPFLTNGVGEEGDYYEVSVGGTVDFGDGEIIFVEGDTVAYTGGKWNKADKPLINDDEIALDTTWSSSKILQVIETSSTADVFTYKGETSTLPSGDDPRQAGDVYLLTTDGLPYWYDGDNWRVFGSQQSILPTASADWVGQVFQYIGATGNGLVKGYFYECVSDGEEPATYSWVALSVNFTTEEKTKLAGIESGAQENVIESISVNGTEQTITNKGVDISVPTKTSDITNDSGFIDKTVNDLDNYYTESETDTLLSAKQPKTLDAPITVAGTIETTVEGTLSALNSAKANTSDLSTVATTGDYTDLSNTPTLGTASAKDSTTYINPGNNDIPTSNAVYQAMTSMLEGAFHPAGNKTCAELTSDLLVQANVGHIYKITDNGTTDANWIGGAGQTITAGQMAVVVYGNTAGTFLFNLENGINVDMSTYQTKAITPITVDGTVKSNVEDALDAINALAGSNKTGLGNKADKVSGATNGNFAGLDANGNLTDSGINADSLNDLQLTYNGSTYSTTSALITKLTSDIVARKHSSVTVGGNIAITWTGKSCIIGSYSIYDSGAGFVILDFENDQDGKNHCVYYISNGSATGITWSKLANTSNFYNLSSYGGYATGTKIWWKIPNLFVVGPDFTYRTNVFLLSARESGCSALLTIGDNGSNTRTAKIIMLNGTLDGVADFYFDDSTCSLYYAIQWSRLQIVQLSGQKIDIAEAIQSSSSEATQYTAITPTITATKSDLTPFVPYNQTDGNYLMLYASQHWNTYSNKTLCKAYTSAGELVFAGILQWNGNSFNNIIDRIFTKQAGSGSITATNEMGSVAFSTEVTCVEMYRLGSHD